MTASLLALVPCAVVIVAVLGMGWPGLQAAAAAFGVGALLVLGGSFDAPSQRMFVEAAQDSALLTVLVAATTVPGVFFIEATRRLGTPEAVQRAVAAFRLNEPRAAILIAVGLGVLVESLTGNGVSLLLTVPLLAGRMAQAKAIALALVGMSLMPWGALAIAGTVGATLAGLEPEAFGRAIWRGSGVVAAVLPLLAVGIAGGARGVDVGVAVLVGALLLGVTYLATVTLGMSLAGVVGGLTVAAVMAASAERAVDWRERLGAAALRPYGVLIAAVLVQTLVVFALVRSGLKPALSTGRVSFAVLASPGVALVMATLISAWRVVDRTLFQAVLKRCWRPVATVALFMLTARLLVSSGAISALAASLGGLGVAGALAGAVGLGAVGGFITGSGVTGNALFLPGVVSAGAMFGARDLFAGLASSAAGHAAMASLPVAALLLAALPARTAKDDRSALRAGLGLVSVYLVLLMVAGLVQLN